MIIMLLFLSVILCITSAWLFWQVRKHKALVEEARQESRGRHGIRDPEPLLTLRVVDPIALARRESRSARILADRLPETSKKIVYQFVMKELKKEMKARKIPVTIQLEYRQVIHGRSVTAQFRTRATDRPPVNNRK